MPIQFTADGGLSRGDNLGKLGSYIYGSGIDNVSNPSYFEVAKKPKKIVSNLIKPYKVLAYNEYDDELIGVVDNTIKNITKGTNIFSFGSTGMKMQSGWITSYKGLPVETDNDRTKIPLIFFIRSTLYCLGPAFDVSENSLVYNYDTRLYEIGDGSYVRGDELGIISEHINRVPMDFIASSSALMYIASGKMLIKLLSLASTVYNLGLEIAIKESGNGFTVYDKKGLVQLWDGNSKGAASSYPTQLDILRVVTLGGMDYMFCKTGLYYMNGIRATALYKKTISQYTNETKFDFYAPIGGNYVVADDMIWCIENASIGKKICCFGNKIAGAKMSYTVFHHAKNYTEVLYMETDKKGIYISYKDLNGTYGIDYYSFYNTEKQDAGIIIHREYISEKISTLKKAKEIELYAEKVQGDDYIKISYSINNGDFEELATIDAGTTIKNGHYRLFANKREFHKIVFKIEISKNVKLYDFIFYEE